ncbi:Protein root UVB sensitive 2, chloroplastic [Vitis vinifera]|uniref:Protein root UVB sensitive 2, chloroplastic n=1 Tax=Vitis vinifera TaxID=29760 RepID=A0A438KDN9_VITVI|nr:Protein root UVB sensitive 2, chloroplastic [Vitis vinifera]
MKKEMKKEQERAVAQGAVFWIETSDSVSRHYQFHSNGDLSMKVVDDSRTVLHRVVESFLNKFFLLGILTGENRFLCHLQHGTMKRRRLFYLFRVFYVLDFVQRERGVSEIHAVPGSATLFQCGIVCAFNSVLKKGIFLFLLLDFYIFVVEGVLALLGCIVCLGSVF